MRLVDANSGIEIIERQDCLALLDQEVLGRLGFIAGGHPEVLPVNYVLDGDGVVFRTASGSKLDGAVRQPVAFEVDGIDRASRSGWSVVVHGIAQEVTSFDRVDLRDRLLALPLDPWVGDKHHLVRITPRSITGRRVAPSTARP